MADIFISYTKSERSLTAALAANLEKAGFTVWWDTELLPMHRFRLEIDRQLDSCSAAVIVWSAHSVKSDWVLSEADHAMRQGKLVNAHHHDIAPVDLPKPFGQIHAVPITDTDRIIAAVNHIRSSHPPEPSSWSQDEVAARQFINEAVADVLRQAKHLNRLSAQDGWENIDTYTHDLLTAARQLETPLRLFRERLPYSVITSYRGRTWIENLQRATEEPARLIEKEIRWLRQSGRHRSVVISAREDLSHAAALLLVELASE